MNSHTFKKNLESSIEKYVGSTVTKIQELPPGANSRIYKVTTDNRETFCVKHYAVRPGDRRDRLNNEFNALEFLWQNSIGLTPQPIARDEPANIGVYSFIKGNTLRNTRVSSDELSQAAGFLTSLHALRLTRGANKPGPASEACFSFNEYIQIINERRQRFSQIKGKIPQIIELDQWVINEWDTAWREAIEFVMESIRTKGLSFSDSLPTSFRTLSPSDFGFHNAIKQTDGRLVFLDFEYFGWDDPAKLIVDFLLHPGMNLTNVQKRWFLKKNIILYSQDPIIPIRLPLIYILLGCKWCLILLNCFFETVPHDLQWQRLCTKQLGKAQRLLCTLRNEMHSGTMMTFST